MRTLITSTALILTATTASAFTPVHPDRVECLDPSTGYEISLPSEEFGLTPTVLITNRLHRGYVDEELSNGSHITYYPPRTAACVAFTGKNDREAAE